MRVLLADDQIAIRSALRLLLEQEPHLEVIGEAHDAGSLLAALQTSRPDVVLLDWELPGMSASALTQRLREFHPQMCIIALSSRPEAEIAAMLAGADAFIDKCSPPDSLIDTFETLALQDSSGD